MVIVFVLIFVIPSSLERIRKARCPTAQKCAGRCFRLRICASAGERCGALISANVAPPRNKCFISDLTRVMRAQLERVARLRRPATSNNRRSMSVAKPAATMPTKTARRFVLFPEVPSRWSMRPLRAVTASGSRHGRLRAGRRRNRQSLLGRCR